MPARLTVNRSYKLERVLERPSNGDIANPTASYNEMFMYGAANGKLYFAAGISAWHTADFHVYSYEPYGAGLVLIDTLQGGVAWTGVPDLANNRIYVVGEEPGDNGTAYRMMAGYIDLTDDTFHHFWHPETADVNELIGVGLDAANGRLLAGERTSGGVTTGSSWTGGRRLWSIPLATIDNPATWVMHWQNPFDRTIAHPVIAYKGDCFLFQGAAALRTSPLNDLANWTTLDSTNVNGLVYSPVHDAVFTAVVTAYGVSGYQLKKWDGDTWTSVTVENYGPHNNTMVDFGDGRLLMDTSGAGGVYRTGFILVDPLTGKHETLVRSPGVIRPSRNAIHKLGDDWYFCSANPGALWRLKKR